MELWLRGVVPGPVTCTCGPDVAVWTLMAGPTSCSGRGCAVMGPLTSPDLCMASDLPSWPLCRRVGLLNSMTSPKHTHDASM